MLGGRARCVPRDGLPLDNGQHLLLGAYADTLALAAAVGDDDTRSAWTRGPLAIRPFAKTQRNGLSFVARDLPGAWGLLVALLRARGLVASRRAGQAIYYSLAGREAPALLAALYEMYCRGAKP